MKTAVAQFSGSLDRQANLAAVTRLAHRAAQAGARMLCFHELANTVYPPFAEDRSLFAGAEPEGGESVSAVRALARTTGMLIVYPFFERDGERHYNAAVVIGPDGTILAKYRKTSIPLTRLLPGASERFYFSRGDLGFPVVDTPFGIRVGLIICYDRNLPEPARCAALNGAELLFVPVTTVARTRPWWELLLRARAVENVMFVAAANRVGQDHGGAPDTHYFGESLIVAPDGEVIGHGSPAGEDLVVATLDRNLLDRQRKTWLFFDDRRPDLYEPIVRGAVGEGEPPGP
jgi:beta-ureidopropionase